jgi:predicted RND superfamily exporter protein
MNRQEDNKRLGERTWEATGDIFRKKSLLIVAITIGLSMILLLPLGLMTPDDRVTGNPKDEVFDLSDRIDDRMPAAYKYTGFIVEAKDDDILTQKELYELYLNEEELRNSELGSTYLINRYDVTLGTWIPGIYSIADEVNRVLVLNMNTSLEDATDEMVKFAIHIIFSSPQGREFINTLSERAESSTGTYQGMEIEIWTSEALLLETFSDNVRILEEYSGTLDDGLDDIIVKEHYDRELQDILRGDQENYRLWGIAIDVGLEAEEEGMMSFGLIFAAVVMIIVLITILFRSPRVSLLTTIGLGLMLLWWKAASNLVGIKASLTVDILVPVSMMVLGVDYLIHAMHRYEEERAGEKEPRDAMGLSIAGVGSALFLAMMTTVVAFGSNMISEIDEIRGFGLSASISIVSAFWIMGFFIPAVKMLWDQRKFRKGKKIGGRTKEGKGSELLGSSVLKVAKARYFLLPVILIISIGAGYLATELEAKLDVKEYFDPSSDFVVSLDKLGEHVQERGGEQVIFYVEGDLEDPEVMGIIIDLEREMDDNENIARDPNTGEVQIYMDILTPLENMFRNPYALNAVSAGSGMEITDNNNDSIPDTREQLRGVLNYIHDNGIPHNESFMMYEKEEIRQLLWISEDGNEYATIVMSGIQDTREIEAVREGEAELKEDIKILKDAEGIEDYGLTGPPLFRERQLTAITDSLTISIGVAIVLCFVVLVILFRSFKYALVTVIPEILVAAWLYAVMFLMGYHLNAVTATIAAISIGVGIDYSVHVTARFREELRKIGKKEVAMKVAASHSGVALFGSAASTMVGFAIIAFAPMPMFSSFGILTALMILMALVASLFVLPSLLLLVARDEK